MKIAELFASEQMTNTLLRVIRVLLVILVVAWIIHAVTP
jgi:flagellar biogenesis protein FliO